MTILYYFPKIQLNLIQTVMYHKNIQTKIISMFQWIYRTKSLLYKAHSLQGVKAKATIFLRAKAATAFSAS